MKSSNGVSFSLLHRAALDSHSLESRAFHLRCLETKIAIRTGRPPGKMDAMRRTALAFAALLVDADSSLLAQVTTPPKAPQTRPVEPGTAPQRGGGRGNRPIVLGPDDKQLY